MKKLSEVWTEGSCMKGYCPDCFCQIPSRGNFCCDACHEKRKEALKAKENLPVGGMSSSPEFENSDIGGGVPCGRSDVRGLPALRDDVRWHQYKHGGG